MKIHRTETGHCLSIGSWPAFGFMFGTAKSHISGVNTSVDLTPAASPFNSPVISRSQDITLQNIIFL